MIRFHKLAISLLLICFVFLPAKAVEFYGRYNLSGYIRDAASGEGLFGANVVVPDLHVGAVTNQYGYFSIELPEGDYKLIFSFIGYAKLEKEISISNNQTINIELREDVTSIPEVEIHSEGINKNITSIETGSTELNVKNIRRIPALMGEVDVIKTIQLLPGVQATSEGSSGFSVRGGSADQNLILLDEAVIYNASHLMGFFSVFNNDALKDVKLYRGDIPAGYGGRLSSVLDIRMKEGNMKTYHATGGVGSIASRLTFEGPVVKNKSSFLVSGRRTYADIFLPLAKDEDLKNNRLYFYDLNGKVNTIINENNRLFFSGYFGRDVFKNQFAQMNFGNRTLSLRWNHLFSKKLFSNFSLITTRYSYELGTPEGEATSFRWTSDITDYGFKADFSYFTNPYSTLKFGLVSILHGFNPGTAEGIGEQTAFSKFKVPESRAFEHAFFIMREQKKFDRLAFKYGLRISAFQNLGKAEFYAYDDNFEVTDSLFYASGEIFNTYLRLEPRIGINFIVNENTSLKTSYSRTNQFVQLAQNSTSGTPLDVWFPASPNVKPQKSDQYSLGFYRNFRNHTIQTSVVGYYKKMTNTIDFKDHATLLLNPKLEGEIRSGSAWSAGVEVMLELKEKKINGWISYTLSKTRRKIDGINNGKPYDAPYDKPHDISVVLNYRINPKWSVGSNWVYSTGIPYTFPVGRYEVMHTILPVYSGRNEYRFDNYHRLDFSLVYNPSAGKEKGWQSEWNLSVYNVYNRKNTWDINFIQNTRNRNITYAEKTYLFSIVPAITYNFRF